MTKKQEWEALRYRNVVLLKAATEDPRTQSFIQSLLPPEFSENQSRLEQLSNDIEMAKIETLMRAKHKIRTTWNSDAKAASRALEGLVYGGERQLHAENPKLKRYLFKTVSAVFVDKTMNVSNQSTWFLVDWNWKNEQERKREGVKFYVQVGNGKHLKELLEAMYLWVLGGPLPEKN